MSNWGKGALLVASLLATLPVIGQDPTNPHTGRDVELGREATPGEVKAWDIDVRPDFNGLPQGAGTALEGEEIWLEKCAACHGDFGDANNFFSPLVLGNVTEDDIASGNVAALQDPTRVRTTLMKVPTVSTLWDYIHRAMPWNSPKSLSPDEVYAVLAYLLNLGYIIDEDFVLDRDTIAEVQARMPNRNGMTMEHGMWKVDGVPDVSNTRCMKNCREKPEITSFIPQFAMSAHGNLALQNRQFGPYRGLETGDGATTTDADKNDSVQPLQAENLVADKGCSACHQLDKALVGPAFRAVAQKYAGDAEALAYLSAKIRKGGSGVWGGVMPPQAHVSENEAEKIAGWLVAMANETN
jgi:cytochrome c